MLTHNKSLLICSRLFVPYCPSTSVLSVLVSVVNLFCHQRVQAFVFWGLWQLCGQYLCGFHVCYTLKMFLHVNNERSLYRANLFPNGGIMFECRYCSLISSVSKYLLFEMLYCTLRMVMSLLCDVSNFFLHKQARIIHSLLLSCVFV